MTTSETPIPTTPQLVIEVLRSQPGDVRRSPWRFSVDADMLALLVLADRHRSKHAAQSDLGVALGEAWPPGLTLGFDRALMANTVEARRRHVQHILAKATKVNVVELIVWALSSPGSTSDDKLARRWARLYYDRITYLAVA